MKKAFLILTASIITLFSYGQTAMPLNEAGKIEFASVVTVDTTTAGALYSKSKLFVANAFTSAKDVTQLSDDAAKTIVAKGLMPVSIKSLGSAWEFGHVAFTITIQCKDGRYKYSVTDLVHTYNHNGHDASGGSLENEKPACGTLLMTKKQWGDVKAEAAQTIQKLIEGLQKTMAQSTAKDNW